MYGRGVYIIRGCQVVRTQSCLTERQRDELAAAIARLGGLYKRDYGKSHGVSLADAVVAATTTFENAELKTLNVKHYPMFDAIEPAYRK